MLFYSFIHVVSPVDSVKVRRTGEVKEKLSLEKADRVFYRQRRTMEDSYGMPHGTFSGV